MLWMVVAILMIFAVYSIINTPSQSSAVVAQAASASSGMVGGC